MSPDEAKYCLLAPDTRHVEQLIIDNDSSEVNDLLEIFMGPHVEPRRKYLIDNVVELQN